MSQEPKQKILGKKVSELLKKRGGLFSVVCHHSSDHKTAHYPQPVEGIMANWFGKLDLMAILVMSLYIQLQSHTNDINLLPLLLHHSNSGELGLPKF